MTAHPGFSAGFLRNAGKQVLGGALAVGLLLGLYGGLSSRTWAPVVIYPVSSLIFGLAVFGVSSLVFPRVRARSRTRLIAAQLAIAIAVMTLTSFVVVNGVSLLQAGLWMLSRDAAGHLRAPIAIVYFAVPILPVALMTVFQFNQTWVRVLQLENRAREADELAASAQLEALRAQIDPHFLFNSLNSIAQLISTDPARAEACVERLAEIFRYLLRSRDRSFVTLEDEIEIVSGYLEIERARFGAKLDVALDIEDRARKWIVPTLIVQPLVENAVRHGISRKLDGGRVDVGARVEDDELVISVRDTGVGMADGALAALSNGVGLRNVRDRLDHLYGRTYRPEIWSRPGVGTRITMRVPRQVVLRGASSHGNSGLAL